MFFDEFSIKSEIRNIHDWPDKGVNFRDISPIFQNPKIARMVTDAFAQRYIGSPVTHIAAIDARGFLLGSNLAYVLNKPLVLIRKQGRLPGATDREEYQSEYGNGVLEIQKGTLDKASRVLLVDDLIASGGTMLAATRLIRHQEGHVAEAAAIVDLPDRGGTRRIIEAEVPVFTLCAFED